MAGGADPKRDLVESYCGTTPPPPFARVPSVSIRQSNHKSDGMSPRCAATYVVRDDGRSRHRPILFFFFLWPVKTSVAWISPPRYVQEDDDEDDDVSDALSKHLSRRATMGTSGSKPIITHDRSKSTGAGPTEDTAEISEAVRRRTSVVGGRVMLNLSSPPRSPDTPAATVAAAGSPDKPAAAVAAAAAVASGSFAPPTTVTRAMPRGRRRSSALSGKSKSVPGECE